MSASPSSSPSSTAARGPDPDRVTVTVTDGVAEVVLSRPDKMNALDGRMFSSLVAAGDQVAADRSVRAVVLRGEGRSFCAGLDLGAFSAMAASGEGGGSDGGGGASDVVGSSIVDRMPGRPSNLPQEAANVWQSLPQPVVAALHGHVLGGGLQVALGADIRFSTPDATLSVMEVRWGLLPDMTGPQALVRLCGLDVAKELVFTARRISGDEAHALGLVTHVVDDPVAAARALAAEIAGRNPEAVQGAKVLLNLAGTRPLEDSLVDESRRMEALMGSPNQVEAVMAEMEGRPPRFTDPR
ncbi:crotonase/enoyl-CoA hydratase family protein [Iamia sp. SCSIO 61187]|uniref:crotonase/enoyl-CoA hydratase family protein n=1 Tax=Iamia sp. SCSIO 61187 TaxID=2722752 RepID=UPI001C62BDCE|nr:crotonase/enoyl-CoA hydratase family protein [Iamia sp. SCSIO 61187]QYG92986.1 crotonase/enoyl-CoA hydratase family protein [Iamia sp. SCSIO 61187]